MLYLVIIMFLLSCADHIKTYERNILHQMNRTAVKGETVILHCNGTLTGEHKDIGWRKDGNVLFIYSPVINQTVTNYTSSRMQADPRNPRKLQISDIQLSDAGLYSCFPLNMQWILIIEVSEHSLQQGRPFYIVFSVTTACVAVGLFIFCAVCFHRKQKERAASDRTETGDELVYTMTSSNNFAIGYSFES
ncbi:uncharacterized protein LOC113526232 isoform X2 [Pangasianodon hypophthalmus]|uniref:uncharacterized protein LOC113526232 isoform X2 n=1 Tax=Pangasianodon hypophthalmus TaxID=310915 RepID=UPI0023078768|nr:uncharacterized protein LOC113526232 isoform X2 [Pangasianodon hypophthalmus]